MNSNFSENIALVLFRNQCISVFIVTLINVLFYITCHLAGAFNQSDLQLI